MISDEKELTHLLGKKYVYGILKFLESNSNQRFKDLASVCPIEKMRNQRLRELENAGLITTAIKRIGRRPISVYSISERGKKILKLVESIKKL